jgi:uncharacterized RDD family membrane protein YckC
MPTDPQNNPLENSVNPYAAPKSVDLVAVQDGPVLATRESRLVAAIIDGLVQSVIFFPIMLIAFGGWAEYLTVLQEPSVLMLFGMQALSFGFFVLINGYYLAQNGQTIGKKIMKIKIVRTDGSKAEFYRLIFLRYFQIYVITAIPVVGGILYLINILLIFRASHQCLHDNIADTIVVNAASESKSAQ